ncbi:tRNA (guanine(37)-N(1))-methyltransferase [Takifugu rubripes]|uniref:tRNA (guanine(37)-N1)-methyltransferase n=1 Tax=Takifugu rubripes TaxID=31033 RepID=H2TS57_TAKRU|nr:tRNA (guanine(37)-N1)-methyltransferase [Takifugu rubripes]|eukprot:XP_003962722.2 PREDICTED: LOW QUALITY PROTEIN: tRNA (guanine(37)-N1)-methyltransferase [Takifugu rubripes]
MWRYVSRACSPTFMRRNLNSVVAVVDFCSAVSVSALISASGVVKGMEQKIYRPPPQVRGMTCLDREAFTQTITVPALRVPTGVLNKVVKSLKKSTIQRPGLPRVIHDKEECSDFRLVLLDPHKVTSAASFSEDEAEALRSFDVPEELQNYELQLTYHNLKTEEVLEAVLPQGQDVTSAFSRVGHIAHMNLREHQLPYKSLIGQVIIDKNPGITCVVNKTNIIDSTYRNFKMEMLAGEENMVAKVKENGVSYEFDFSRVYWNPRLSTEHQRVVELVKRGDAVFDVFAGVGPFAIPAARLGANVVANDLNPESHRWLQHNCKLNKVENKVRTFNLDGRAFIQGPLKQELPALLKGKMRVHIVMNLPALALEFLDAFRGLLHESPSDGTLPTVYCYCFSKDENPETDVVKRASHSLGFPLEGRSSVHFVRNVAPNKDMLCVRFSLPTEVVFSGDHGQTDSSSEPAPKRQKCEEAADSASYIHSSVSEG